MVVGVSAARSSTDALLQSKIFVRSSCALVGDREIRDPHILCVWADDVHSTGCGSVRVLVVVVCFCVSGC